MNGRIAFAVAVVLALLVLLIRREEGRGTFDPAERFFLSWLVANDAPRGELPELTLVLYDEESLALSGEGRLGVLDTALFARAASRLGAVAIGVEGLEGDSLRVVDAARGTRVFGGSEMVRPPGAGWTPVQGIANEGWLEIPGAVGLPGRFTRGFIPDPAWLASDSGVLLVGKCGDRVVPSFMALAWVAARGWRPTDLVYENGALRVPDGTLPVGPDGGAGILEGSSPRSMTLNDLLVAAELHEREGAESPVRGQVVVLARATPEVTRLAARGMDSSLPMELCLRSWESLRSGQVFRRAGWWYGVLLWAGACLLALGPARRTNGRAVTAAVFSTLLYLLVALGLFAGTALFLPLAPWLLTMVLGLAAGRIGYGSGWLGK
jgi:hypothetical protein